MTVSRIIVSRHLIVAMLISGVLPVASLTSAEDAEREEPRDTHWVWPVAYPEGSSELIKAAASKLQELLMSSFPEPMAAKKNPGCCFWIDVTNWKPNPGRDGYVVVIHQGGAQLVATNTEQLDLAVKHIGRVTRVNGGKSYVPEGLLTNYKVIDSKDKE